MRLEKRGDVVSTEVDGELLVLDLHLNQIHHLNLTASYVWREYDGRKSPAELAAALANHFDIDIETAKIDVDRMVSQLKGLNLLVETNSVSDENL